MPQQTAARPRESGFTLIELLVSLAIIGLLAATAIPVYQNAVAKAQRAALLADMSQLYSAFVRYHADHGQFPSDAGGGALDIATLAPLSTSGYYATPTALNAKLYQGHLWWYWAPDWNGPDADFILIGRSKQNPSLYVYAMHYGFDGWSGYDGVYVWENGVLTRSDGSS